MASPAKIQKKPGGEKPGGGGVRFLLFRLVPVLLCFAALFVAAAKVAPESAVLSAAAAMPEYATHIIRLPKSDWLIVIVCVISAIVIVFVGSLVGGRGREEEVPLPAGASWRDGAKVDRNKCAKASCRRMRVGGKLLCPECWDEWQKQTPRSCAECGDDSIAQDTTIPLCKPCHQRWLA